MEVEALSTRSKLFLLASHKGRTMSPHDAFEQWQRRDQLKDGLALTGVAVAAVWLIVCIGGLAWYLYQSVAV